MEKRTSSLQVIWFFFKNYKLQVLALFILSLLVGGLEAANVAAVYPILSAALEGGFGEGNFILSIPQAIHRDHRRPGLLAEYERSTKEPESFTEKSPPVLPSKRCLICNKKKDLPSI